MNTITKSVKEKFNIAHFEDCVVIDEGTDFLAGFDAEIREYAKPEVENFPFVMPEALQAEFTNATGLKEHVGLINSLVPISNKAILECGAAYLQSLKSDESTTPLEGFLGMETLITHYIGTHDDVSFCEKNDAYFGTFLHVYEGPQPSYEIRAGSGLKRAETGKTVFINDEVNHSILPTKTVIDGVDPILIVILKLYKSQAHENMVPVTL